MTMHKSFRHFLSAELDVPKKRKSELQQVKDDVREELRKNLPTTLKQEFGDYSIEFAVPKFRTQGSWTHGTLNMPAYSSQHIDIDDGVYIKLEYLKDKAEPITCSVGMFNAVENAIRLMCQKNGWTIVRNPTCVRIDLNNGAHIDIPIYGTSEKTYQLLEAKQAAAIAKSVFLHDEKQYIDVLTWGMLDHGDVLLAHRELGWICSDPGPITEWVKQAKRLNGPQFITVVRYLKAWRDWQWPQGGPTSICLMVAAERAFVPVQNHDELALLSTIATLAEIFSQKIPNPTDEKEDLAKKLDKNGTRHDVIDKLNAFYALMQQATQSPEQADAIFESCFGPRFPKVKQTSTEKAAAVVLGTPARKVESPVVKRTRSGDYKTLVKRTHSG